jgi:DnaK suppressor protein
LITDAQLEDFRKRVEGELAEVNISLSLPGGADAPVDLDQTRVGRLSRMDAMQQQAMASGIKARLQLRKRRLEAARERMNSGEYGICCACGSDMPLQRLLADVGTPFCAACRNDIDARRQASF